MTYLIVWEFGFEYLFYILNEYFNIQKMILFCYGLYTYVMVYYKHCLF